MKTFFLLIFSFLSFQSLAGGQFIGRESFRTCGGSVDLRRASNGDLALNFIGRFNSNYCTKLVFVDVSNRQEIKSYSIQGASYTLSKTQRSTLNADCTVEFQLVNYRGVVVERKHVRPFWWCDTTRTSHAAPPNYMWRQMGYY